jgi:hypothetical protein
VADEPVGRERFLVLLDSATEQLLRDNVFTDYGQRNNIAERTDAVDRAGILTTRGSPSPPTARQLIRAFGGTSMLIPVIPDADLERLYWNSGGGRGAAGYRHAPSGITVAESAREMSRLSTSMRWRWRNLSGSCAQGFLSNGDGASADASLCASPDHGDVI